MPSIDKTTRNNHEDNIVHKIAIYWVRDKINRYTCKDLLRVAVASDEAFGAVAGHTEAPAAACDVGDREVPNPDEDQALADAASEGGPGTATYIVKSTAPNKLDDDVHSSATMFSVVCLNLMIY